jgi:putative acetyltransferase
MIIYVRTNSENDDFQKLVKELDADLAVRDGAEHAFYDQYNKIDTIKYALVAYDNAIPVGCGAIKEFASDSVEVKRMYVLPNRRGQGIASIILTALE